MPSDARMAGLDDSVDVRMDDLTSCDTAENLMRTDEGT